MAPPILTAQPRAVPCVAGVCLWGHRSSLFVVSRSVSSGRLKEGRQDARRGLLLAGMLPASGVVKNAAPIAPVRKLELEKARDDAIAAYRCGAGVDGPWAPGDSHSSLCRWQRAQNAENPRV